MHDSRVRDNRDLLHGDVGDSSNKLYKSGSGDLVDYETENRPATGSIQGGIVVLHPLWSKLAGSHNPTD